MSSFLDEVVFHKKAELQQKKSVLPESELKKDLKPGSASFLKALESNELKIIAEVKPRSPSLGQLDSKVELTERLEIYQRNAQAVSVLCDQKYFGGSIDLLRTISSTLTLPTLLKDFVIDPYQIYEARAAGAQAVLLIVKILSAQQLSEFSELINELGMTPLVEVQTESELEAAAAIEPDLLLINNRNLDNLKMDLGTVKRLVDVLNFQTRVVAASGIESAADMISMRQFASRFLVGSALMSSDDPEGKFLEFRQAELSYLDNRGEQYSCQK